MLTLLLTRKIAPLPVILVGETYWCRAVDLEFLADEGMIDRRDHEPFTYCESAAQICHAIGSRYALRPERAPARCDTASKWRAV